MLSLRVVDVWPEPMHADPDTDPYRSPTIECLQADPLIEIADALLAQADPRFVSVGDGIATFHCANGDVSYGLREHCELRETWIGIRSDVEQDDLA